MSIQPIFESLEKLTQIHESLLDCSKEKTEVIKEGSAEKLQILLAKEHKLIRLLEQTEQKRQEHVDCWFEQQQVPESEDRTITHMLEILNESESDATEKLESLAIALTEVITKLKQQEQLNQALIEQSMKFIQMSLNILNPTIDNYNYGQSETKTVDRSVFDSRA